MSLKLGLAAVLVAALAACASPSSSDVGGVTANETEGDTATVHFGANDWTPTWSGDVKAGGSLAIDYDFDRLPQCRNTSSLDSWVVEVNWRFDGGATHHAALPGSPGAGEWLDNATIEIPSSAKTIELWFENHAVGGYDDCAAWDSQYGANYTHAL